MGRGKVANVDESPAEGERVGTIMDRLLASDKTIDMRREVPRSTPLDRPFRPPCRRMV